MMHASYFLLALLAALFVSNAARELADPAAVENLQRAIDSLSPAQIPAAFKHPFRDDKNSHWCCKITMPIIQIQKTKLISIEVIHSSEHVCGYQGCGFLNLGSCAVYCTTTWSEIDYKEDAYVYTQSEPCPEQHIICCAGYVNVLGNCYDFFEVQQNHELITILSQTGIVLGK